MIFARLFLSFFRLGLFTIGGGYAMLPLVQKEVQRYGWMTPEEFIDMIAIAEMTPGAIGVNTATFVGFRQGGLLGAVVATAAIALPSLILVVAVSKVLDKFREHPLVAGMLLGIRPVVAGLIASSALFIAEAAFRKIGTTGLSGIDPLAVVLAVVSAVLVRRFRAHPIAIIVGAGIVGLVIF
ncbi:MAG: chromate transporter [Firmicutes bacterium]|nr:chromate transporter [Bacillota bacterium]